VFLDRQVEKDLTRTISKSILGNAGSPRRSLINQKLKFGQVTSPKTAKFNSSTKKIVLPARFKS